MRITFRNRLLGNHSYTIQDGDEHWAAFAEIKAWSETEGCILGLTGSAFVSAGGGGEASASSDIDLVVILLCDGMNFKHSINSSPFEVPTDSWNCLAHSRTSIVKARHATYQQVHAEFYPLSLARTILAFSDHWLCRLHLSAPHCISTWHYGTDGCRRRQILLPIVRFGRAVTAMRNCYRLNSELLVGQHVERLLLAGISGTEPEFDSIRAGAWDLLGAMIGPRLSAAPEHIFHVGRRCAPLLVERIRSTLEPYNPVGG